MIHPDNMKYGLVVLDPKATAPDDAHRYFKIASHETEQGWRALHISSQRDLFFTRDDLPRLRAASPDVHCEADVSFLLGKKIQLHTDIGTVSGTLRLVEVRGVEIAQEGSPSKWIHFPVMFSLDDEEYFARRVTKITILED